MPRYRLYFLNTLGRIEAASDLEGPSDEEALTQATRAADGRAMELWEGERRVKLFPAAAPDDTT